jgi:hypothetical protein
MNEVGHGWGRPDCGFKFLRMCYWLLPLFHPKLKVFLSYSVNKALSRFRLHFPVAVNVNSSLSRGSLSV